jgi:hypothetical protein
MTETKKMTQREERGRAKHAEFIMTAAMTLRGYGYPELGDEIAAIAARVRTGELDFDAERVMY